MKERWEGKGRKGKERKGEKETKRGRTGKIKEKGEKIKLSFCVTIQLRFIISYKRYNTTLRIRTGLTKVAPCLNVYCIFLLRMHREWWLQVDYINIYTTKLQLKDTIHFDFLALAYINFAPVHSPTTHA
jgi:hypothetical protein